MMNLVEMIDLDFPGIEKVKDLWNQKDTAAAAALLDFLRRQEREVLVLQRDKLVERLKQERPIQIKKTADQLMADTYVFNDPWDMEKCLDAVVFPEGEIDWHHVHQGDDEWMFMINRHHFLIRLLQQYFVSDDPKYYHKLEAIIRHWMTQEPDFAGRENSSWRTIDTGLRLKNWTRLIEYLLICPEFTASLLLEMLYFIHKQIDYLLSSYSPEKALSNWRVLEFHGVFIAACKFGFLRNSQEAKEKATEVLAESIELQVTNDGFHWEQSFMYHHEVLICCLETMRVANQSGYTLPKEFVKKTLSMAQASSHIITPRGEQTCYGDSDIEQLFDIFALAASQFPKEKFGQWNLEDCSEELWLLYGPEILEEVVSVDRSPLEATDFAHEDVGNYFLRTGWGRFDSFLFFKNGFLGSGHGHADLLHIDLIVNGISVLVDSGRFTYNPEDERRQFYKSSQAHNTCMIDQQEFVVQKRAWGTVKVPLEIKRPCVLNEEVVLVQGMHLGYLDNGHVVNRKIIWIKPDIWLVVDQVISEQISTCEFQQYLHFAQPLVEEITGGISYPVGQRKVDFLPLDGQAVNVEACMISPAYNQEYQSQRVELSTMMVGSSVSRMLIIAADKPDYKIEKLAVFDMNRCQVSEDHIGAVKIQHRDLEWIIVTNYSEEPNSRKLYLVDGVSVYGRSCVIKKASGLVRQKATLEY